MFGSYSFDMTLKTLRSGDSPIALPARTADLLRSLLSEHGRVVCKSRLIEEVWGAVFVDESNLKVQIAALRRILRDVGKDPAVIRTIKGRGYQFIAPVRYAGCGTSHREP